MRQTHNLSISTLILCLAVLFSGCGKSTAKSEAPLPFKKAENFRYKRNTKKGSQTQIIKFVKSTDGKWLFSRDLVTEYKGRQQKTEGWRFHLDKAGYIKSPAPGKMKALAEKNGGSLNDQTQDRLVKIWLPTGKRKVGAKVNFKGFPDPCEVTKKDKYGKWKVWVVTFGKNHTFYFDQKTGIKVGYKSGGQSWKLVGTSYSGVM